MPKVLKNAFADDTVVYVCIHGTSPEEIVTKLNDDLSQLSEWLCAKKLKLNVEKSIFMYLRSSHKTNITPKILKER